MANEGEMYVQFDFDPKKITAETRDGLVKAMRKSSGAVARRAKKMVPRGADDVYIGAKDQVTVTAGKKKTKVKVKHYKGRKQKHLRDAIRYGVRDKDSGPIAFVNADEMHSRVIEYGGVKGRTDPHPGKHPGREHRRYEAQPFLIPAFEAETKAFEAAISAVIDKALDDAGDKG